MYSYIIRRLLLIIPTLLGIMVINFMVIQFVPGGPVEQMIAQITGEGVDATPAPVGDALFVRGERHLFCVIAHPEEP